jgi:Ca2+-transporting ATPase
LSVQITVVAPSDSTAASRRTSAPRRGEVPFDAGAKMMATAHALPDGPAVVVKGAPESVLALCAGGAGREAALAAAEELAGEALRVLAFARADGALPEAGDPWEALRGRARFLGLVGEMDLPREEAGPAVRRCREAGVRPVMVTGDHRATAVAVARRLDVARPGDETLDGAELARLGPEALRERAGRVAVYARVHPEQKLRIVEAHQARGEVVAMTGDGVNDAPALARAQVGVAMGRSGSEVAKEAADVVLTDDDFATLVAAVAEGRLVHRNLRKALTLLLSTGLAEIAVLLGALVAGLPLPFAAVQILWNNVVTEGTVTVNLSMEPAEGDEMRGPPVDPAAPLVGGALLARILWMGLVISAVTLGTFAWDLARGTPLPRARTAAFTLLALCEWANVLNVRSERGSAFSRAPWSNPWLLAGLAASVTLQAAVLTWPPLMRAFHTVPLAPAELLRLVGLAAVVLAAEEGRKAAAWLRRRAARRSPAGQRM